MRQPKLAPWVLQKIEDEKTAAWIKPRKPFISWDGEGVVHTNREDMSYVLFGNSTGDRITGYQLSTDECLEFIMEQAQLHPNAIHVSFGFNFDVDQILRDIEPEQLELLKKNGRLKWNGYTIEWIPRKLFVLRKRGMKSITISDTLSFFGVSLIKACEQYIPDDERLAFVTAGKANRSVFRWDELHSHIIPYWKQEQQLLVELMDALRYSLISAGMPIQHWHGPGAVASYLINKQKLSTHILASKAFTPPVVTDATAYSYFGGRFECVNVGYVEGPIYSYDIRSAYPSALTVMPACYGGEWERTKTITDWGLYRTEWNHENVRESATPLGLGALPVRTSKGTVSYALSGSGWHYGHEIRAAELSGMPVTILDGWVHHSNERPFQFMHELYVKRAEWKRQGNAAQLAAKLGLNSIYGKLAQLVGYDEKTGEPPKYHQQWYAGQITSWCRARLFLAMMQQPDDIIGVETDGIYSRKPLKVRLGEHLGEWEAEQYDAMVYVQSGLYFLRKGDQWIKSRTRGLGRGKVGYQDVKPYVNNLDDFTGTDHRYGGMGSLGTDRHYKWFDQSRTIRWGGDGKRTHDEAVCPACLGNATIHRTVMTMPHAGPSHPRSLPWSDIDVWTDTDVLYE